MKMNLVLVACMLFSTATFAEKKPRCKKKYTEVSCEGIAAAKRKFFCWSGDITPERQERICKKAKRKKKSKSKKISK
jgi:hypothetical protein